MIGTKEIAQTAFEETTGVEIPILSLKKQLVKQVSGLKQAEILRDAELDRISKLSKTQRNKYTTVVGAHDPLTGRVAVGAKKNV